MINGGEEAAFGLGGLGAAVVGVGVAVGVKIDVAGVVVATGDAIAAGVVVGNAPSV